MLKHPNITWTPCVFAFGMLLTGVAAQAGDFSNPRPYSGAGDRASQAALENARRNAGSGSVMGNYILGDYFERYQSATNWNNAVLSGNTIILNGDNNNVSLTTDGSTVTQNSSDICQNTNNTFLNDGGAADTASGICGTSE